MHKLHAKEFSIDDFSCEHLIRSDDTYEWLQGTIDMLNDLRNKYLSERDKEIWDQMVDMLPECYNQRRTVMLNYEVLTSMYHARKNHKLQEWHDFCGWVESLPYSELITG